MSAKRPIRDLINSIRWNVILVLGCAATLALLIALIFNGALPATKGALLIRSDLQALQGADSLHSAITAMQARAHMLDSLIHNRPVQIQSVDAELLKSIYHYADSAGIKVAKLDVSQKLNAGTTIEMPINFIGQAPYRSFGRFIADIENMACATRIRTITLSKNGATTQTLALDFIVMESGAKP